MCGRYREPENQQYTLLASFRVTPILSEDAAFLEILLALS